MENKTSKYFKYAIGEILLVMVGILLALQVNNWNESRKDQNYEQKILLEIKSSLEKDLGRTNFIKNIRLVRKEKAIKNILRAVVRGDNENDTISLRQNLTDVGTTLSFSYDKGPYESLKSVGLEKISSDSLRSELVRFYEVTMPLNIIFIDDDKIENETRRRDLFNDFVSFHFIDEKDNDSIFVAKRTKIETLRKSSSFLRYIDQEERVANNYRRRLERAVQHFETMLSLINYQLEND